MIELVLITLYFLSSSFIYGYYVLRRAFWVVRILEPKDRFKISFIYGLPFVAFFSILLWLTSPLIVFTAFPFIIISASLIVEHNPKWVMPLLIKHIDTNEVFGDSEKESPRIEQLRQKLMTSVQLNEEAINRIVDQIETFRKMINSTEETIEKEENEVKEKEESNVIQVRNPDVLYDSNLEQITNETITNINEEDLDRIISSSDSFKQTVENLKKLSAKKNDKK